MEDVILPQIEQLEDGTQIIRYGKNVVTKHPDGTMVAINNGHKATTLPSGKMILEMNGGHVSEVEKDGSAKISLNYSVIKKVYPANIANVIAVNTTQEGMIEIKEIVFSNGGIVLIDYGPLGEVISIKTVNVTSFGANNDGTEIKFDISENSKNITIH